MYVSGIVSDTTRLDSCTILETKHITPTGSASWCTNYLLLDKTLTSHKRMSGDYCPSLLKFLLCLGLAKRVVRLSKVYTIFMKLSRKKLSETHQCSWFLWDKAHPTKHRTFSRLGNWHYNSAPSSSIDALSENYRLLLCRYWWNTGTFLVPKILSLHRARNDTTFYLS